MLDVTIKCQTYFNVSAHTILQSNSYKGAILMKEMKFFIFFSICCGFFSAAALAESYTDQISEEIEQKIGELNRELQELGSKLGNIVNCGNEAMILAGANCDYIEEQDSFLADYVRAVPDCAADEFLVVAGTHDMMCKHVSQFDYIHSFDDISGATCSGAPPRGKNYCRCGRWVSYDVYIATNSC